MHNITKYHEQFTDQSKSVIKIEELLNEIKNMPIDEQNKILIDISNIAENFDKVNKMAINNHLNLSNNSNDITLKRKVVASKKVRNDQKQCVNEKINNYHTEINNIINMTFEEFKNYLKNHNLNDEYNYYLLGLIKEMNAYNKMADDAFIARDSNLIKEIKDYIEKLNEKIIFLREITYSSIEEEQEICKIIFLESPEQKAYFIEDIEKNIDFKNSFARVINGFLQGRPYNPKTITNNNKLKGLSVAKDSHGKTRTFYVNAGANTYLILTAIIQKRDRVSDYENQVANSYKYYLNHKFEIANLLNDENYIARQESYLKEVKEKLGLVENTKCKTRKAGI